MSAKKKKIIIAVAVGVLAVALAVGGFFFYMTQLQWLDMEDIASEVIWSEGSETVETVIVHALDVTFHTREPSAYVVGERIALRDGVRIKDGRPCIRARDVTALLDGLNAIAATDTSAEVAVIVNGLYGQGTAEQNAMIQALLGDELARDRFELYFQWYNTVHELGHVITVSYGTYSPENMEIRHMVDEEVLVNSFAVAFWMHFGEEEKINALEEMVDYALSNITPPVENMSHLDFMREKVDEGKFQEVFTFETYGWFQFNIVRDALRERGSLDLAALLMEMTGMGDIGLPLAGEQGGRLPLAGEQGGRLEYPTLGADMVPEIVADAISVLRGLGVAVPDVYIAFSTDPNEHAAAGRFPRTLIEPGIEAGRLVPAYR